MIRQCRRNKIIFVVGMILLIASIISLMIVGEPTDHSNSVTINSGDNRLVGDYYSVDNAQYAVLMCGGFSSDRQMMRPMANIMVRSGMSVMTFDYSGHGGSMGSVGFDNATNGQITREIGLAVDKLREMSGLNNDKIILFGHSMGGRSIVEYMCTYTGKPFAEIILLSPQINYDNNTQSSLFTGVTDSDIEPWKSLDGSAFIDTNVLLIGSHQDDIMSTHSMQELYTRLSDKGANTNITLDMVGGVLHSYMVYSATVADSIVDNVPLVSGNGGYLVVMYMSWFVAVAGMMLALTSLYRLLPNNGNGKVLALVKYRSFVLTKLLLWLPALLAMALIACVSVMMPFGSPIMSIAFIGGIAGYGIISLLVHHRGKMKGVMGAINSKTLLKKPIPKKNIIVSLAIFLLTLATLIVVLDSGLYNIYPLNWRLFWLVFATAVMSIGFYVSRHEGMMLEGAGMGKVVLYNATQYMLLLLMGIAYLAMGSYSGLIGLIQNLLLLYICIFAGNAVAKLTNNLWGSICSAFLFQTTMLTATCLMVVF